MSELKQAISALCAETELTDAELKALLDRQQEALSTVTLLDEPAQTTARPDQGRAYRWRKLGSCAALIALCCFSWLFTQIPPQDFARDIAEEAAYNHLKLKPLDIQSASFNELKRFFTLLDFSPSPSQLRQTLQGSSAELLGGRYCSIKGVAAAQLRFQQASLSTFYQVPYNKALHGQIPRYSAGEDALQLTVKGLAVSLWRENDLLMVLVRDL